MAWIEWSDVYSVGVTNFNEQHKKLIAIINKLHEYMSSGGKGMEILGKVIDELLDYAAFHFSAEETLMQSSAYPAYTEHKAKHTEFVGKMVTFKEQYQRGKVLLSLEVMKFLRDWLINHICKIDKEYGPFFNQHGIT